MTVSNVTVTLDTYEPETECVMTIEFEDSVAHEALTNVLVKFSPEFGVPAWDAELETGVYFEYDPGGPVGYNASKRPLGLGYDADAFIYLGVDIGGDPYVTQWALYSYGSPTLLGAGVRGRITIYGLITPVAGTYPASDFGVANAAGGEYGEIALPIVIAASASGPTIGLPKLPSIPALPSIGHA